MRSPLCVALTTSDSRTTPANKEAAENRSSQAAWVVLVLGVFSLFLFRGSIETLVIPAEPEPVVDPHANIDALYARQSTSLEQAGRALHAQDRARAAAQLRAVYDNVHRDFEPFYQLARADRALFRRRVERAVRMAIKDDHGMKVFRVEGGVVRMLDVRGSAFNDGWMKTLGELAPLIPDTTLLLNHRDEPRVAFDPSVPAPLVPLQQAIHSALSPRRPSYYKDEGHCVVPNEPKGFMTYANDASSFLLYSASADFSTDLYPVLSQAKIRPCFGDIMFPSEYYYPRSASSPKYAHPDNVPWAEKKGMLYWRGESTGGFISGTNYRSFPRFRLIDIARKDRRAKGVMDVAITAFHSWCVCVSFARWAADNSCFLPQSNPISPPPHSRHYPHSQYPPLTHPFAPTRFCQVAGCDADAIRAEYDIVSGTTDAPPPPREAAYGYKYVFDVDGNGFSGWYLAKMSSGGLVFKSTVFNEYFDAWLRPYEHYIPVLPDLSDLVDKVLWARKNEGEARRIQAAGQAFVERVLTDGQNDCYFLLVMLEWARLWAGGDGTEEGGRPVNQAGE
ncbi:hypothetical protein C8J57DRAFT_1504357 [Mycena rebaudengoi]|nr:hypothetical protein C8J57DRAFT_1504357 [Mycena rebaudengoi]